MPSMFDEALKTAQGLSSEELKTLREIRRKGHATIEIMPGDPPRRRARIWGHDYSYQETRVCKIETLRDAFCLREVTRAKGFAYFVTAYGNEVANVGS